VTKIPENNIKRKIIYFGAQFQKYQYIVAKGVAEQSSSHHGSQEAEQRGYSERPE
jgi:hypothetical protein